MTEKRDKTGAWPCLGGYIPSQFRRDDGRTTAIMHYNNMGVGLYESAGKLPDYESKWDRFFLSPPLRARFI